MTFTIEPDIFENDDVTITTDADDNLAIEHVPSGQTLTLDESLTIGELFGDVGALQDRTSGLSADGSEADLESVNTEVLGNADNPVTVRVGKVDGSVVAVGRDGLIESDTDAYTVIQAALDYIGSLSSPSGGRLKIARGEYEISQSLVVPSHVHIQGELFGNVAGATILKLADGANTDLFEVPENGGSGSPLFIEWSHLTLAGNKANNTAGSGIWIDEAAHGDYTVRAVFTEEFADHGFDFGPGWGGTVIYAFSEHNDGHGIRFRGGTSPKVGFSKIGHNGGRGLDVGSGRPMIGFNEIFDHDGEGMFLRGSNTGGVVAGNYIRENRGADHDTQIACNMPATAIGPNYIDGQGETTNAITTFGGADDASINHNTIINVADPYDLGGGDRLTVDGLGRNGGDPSSGGAWNGEGREGIRVWDTTNNNLYEYAAGGWRGPLN